MNLPNLYGNTPLEAVPAQTVATFPVQTFLENLTIAADGTLYITSHEAGEIWQLPPAAVPTVYAKIEGKVTGIAGMADMPGKLLVNGWTAEGVPFVATVEQGRVCDRQTLPEAIFLNGITPFTDTHFLMADSYRGAIWQVEVATLAASLWLEHPLLARAKADNPFPGVNGLKFWDGHLYASNTERQVLLRIPLEGGNALPPEVWLEGQNIDDFAFDIHGNLYGTTHVFHSVVRITPSREVAIVAGLAEGMAGCTAVAFAPGDRPALYAVTNGGMTLPPPSGIEPAKVVRLEVAVPGAPLGWRM